MLPALTQPKHRNVDYGTAALIMQSQLRLVLLRQQWRNCAGVRWLFSCTTMYHSPNVPVCLASLRVWPKSWTPIYYAII